MDMVVRPACGEDAVAATDVLRRSIRDLCSADHKGDPEVLAAWLANKTPEMFQEWLAREDQLILVAELDGRVVSVGAVRRPDEILLNYVCPEARFQGVSKRMLQEMEAVIAGYGTRHAKLMSTLTAYPFYAACGYETDGSDEKFGIPNFHMTKDLRA